MRPATNARPLQNERKGTGAARALDVNNHPGVMSHLQPVRAPRLQRRRHPVMPVGRTASTSRIWPLVNEDRWLAQMIKRRSRSSKTRSPCAGTVPTTVFRADATFFQAPRRTRRPGITAGAAARVRSTPAAGRPAALGAGRQKRPGRPLKMKKRHAVDARLADAGRLRQHGVRPPHRAPVARPARCHDSCTSRQVGEHRRSPMKRPARSRRQNGVHRYAAVLPRCLKAVDQPCAASVLARSAIRRTWKVDAGRGAACTTWPRASTAPPPNFPPETAVGLAGGGVSQIGRRAASAR